MGKSRIKMWCKYYPMAYTCTGAFKVYTYTSVRKPDVRSHAIYIFIYKLKVTSLICLV